MKSNIARLELDAFGRLRIGFKTDYNMTRCLRPGRVRPGARGLVASSWAVDVDGTTVNVVEGGTEGCATVFD